MLPANVVNTTEADELRAERDALQRALRDRDAHDAAAATPMPDDAQTATRARWWQVWRA